MTGFFLKPSSTTRGHSRSISLPARSHPTTIKIEQELNNPILNLQLSSSSPSPLKADKLGLAISGLSDLYKSVQDVLKLSQTQQALTLTKNDQASFSSWVDELLEEPLSFLDVCGNLRENITLLRENMGNLQSTLRRINSTSTISSTSNNNIIDNVAHFVSSLKSFKREIAKSLSSLKQIDTRLGVSRIMINNRDQQLVAVVRVLRETSLISSLIFRAILGYFSGCANLQPKPSKWSLVMLKLVNNNKGRGSYDDLNELEDLEGSLNNLMVHYKLNKDDSETMVINQSVCKKLEVLGRRMEALEKELECLFRQLIQTRVYLLNILSDH